ncbi:sigma-54 interaction domain-containing protein [Brevibacillus daliensis]|uniref:sigma-54 interaction domain-containing protein n=1 Tax=Brevibacillus daliensis TaxID=2892995 RepID=UPI001E337E98|nr:sigma 54-interacting transcriptional regulator [Brevibacillus daliensis]
MSIKNESLLLPSNISVERFSSIINAIQDGVLVIDQEGIVILINPEYTKITGVTEEEIIGKPLLSVRPNAQLITAMKSNKVIVGLPRKENNKEYVVDMAPIIMDGQVRGAVSIVKGVIEVHDLIKKLEKSSQEIKLLKQSKSTLSKAKYHFEDIIGSDGSLKRIIDKAKKVSSTSISLFICGESGTGKELLAQSIHNYSDRKDKPFIAINCAAIPEALVESELFGYEEGSFTNAKKGGKPGLFELANGGTVFLDEISELPYDMQAKLLRFLQESTIRRVGGINEIAVNIRIIAAANKDLGQLVEKKLFRQDLYYRLNAFMLQLPPLRSRQQDLESLVNSFLHNKKHALGNVFEGYSIDKEVLEIFRNYYWSGNIRELRNAIDYAVVMADSSTITKLDLPDYLLGEYMNKSSNIGGETLKELVEQTEIISIKNVLQNTENTLKGRKKAANLLGISVATLYNKMKKYGLEEKV